MANMMDQYILAGRLEECQYELCDKCNYNSNTSSVSQRWWEACQADCPVPEGPIRVSNRGEMTMQGVEKEMKGDVAGDVHARKRESSSGWELW